MHLRKIVLIRGQIIQHCQSTRVTSCMVYIVQDNSKVTAFARKYILSNVTITLGCILSVGDF